MGGVRYSQLYFFVEGSHRFNELQNVKSGMGSPDWNVSMVDLHFRKLLWVYCPGHAGVKGNDRADRLASKANLTSGLLLGTSEVLRSLRHYLRAQSQVHHTVDRLEAAVVWLNVLGCRLTH